MQKNPKKKQLIKTSAYDSKKRKYYPYDFIVELRVIGEQIKDITQILFRL